MVLYVLRAVFVLLMAFVGLFTLSHSAAGGGTPTAAWLAMPAALGIAFLFIAIDVLAPRRKLMIFAGSFFGLVVGIAIAFGLSFVVGVLVDQYYMPRPEEKLAEILAAKNAIKTFIDMIVGMVSCYLAISFILQTKDDFRFIIPYVEFSKQTKGARPMLLDTSVLIDGRIADIVETGLIESQLVVPQFVIDELQAVADSADRLKRNRGRRGLDMLAKMRESRRADVLIYEAEAPAHEEGPVDQQLVHLARGLNARVLTNDYNLNKVAQLAGVDVININDLGSALRPVVVPGEKMRVRVVKPGEEPGQGIGYLDDGTMIVVEQARPFLNDEVDFVVTRALQTSAGRMIFGRLVSEGAPAQAKAPTQTPAPRRHNPQSTSR